LFELTIDYPSSADELKVVTEHSFTPLERLTCVLTRDQILRFRDAVSHVPAAPNVVDYAVRLVRVTRPQDKAAPEYIRQWIHWGASPRASQYLILAGRARAACQGRFNVACEDVAALAPAILRHRLVRTFRAEAEGKSTDDIIKRLIDDVPMDL
jgi:MoxR-like ATPase